MRNVDTFERNTIDYNKLGKLYPSSQEKAIKRAIIQKIRSNHALTQAAQREYVQKYNQQPQPEQLARFVFEEKKPTLGFPSENEIKAEMELLDMARALGHHGENIPTSTELEQKKAYARNELNIPDAQYPQISRQVARSQSNPGLVSYIMNHPDLSEVPVDKRFQTAVSTASNPEQSWKYSLQFAHLDPDSKKRYRKEVYRIARSESGDDQKLAHSYLTQLMQERGARDKLIARELLGKMPQFRNTMSNRLQTRFLERRTNLLEDLNERVLDEQDKTKKAIYKNTIDNVIKPLVAEGPVRGGEIKRVFNNNVKIENYKAIAKKAKIDDSKVTPMQARIRLGSMSVARNTIGRVTGQGFAEAVGTTVASPLNFLSGVLINNKKIGDMDPYKGNPVPIIESDLVKKIIPTGYATVKGVIQAIPGVIKLFQGGGDEKK